jgi:hypothetical protein
MKRVCVCGLAVLATLVAAPALAQDNVVGPWGAWFGGNNATGYTTGLDVIFTPGEEVEEVWEFDAHITGGISGLKGRQQMVFDPAGNLYWICDTYWWPDSNRLVSLDSDGNLRWTYMGPDGFGLGRHVNCRQTPIVGGDAIYLTSQTVHEPDPGDFHTSLGDHWFIYAVNPADGTEVWTTELDNEPEFRDGCCYRPNITLLNGKIYAIGNPHDSGERAIYVLNAATGAILQNTTITGLPTDGSASETNTVVVEDVFGAGVHGLYGTWLDAVYCISVDTVTPTAALEWADPVGPIPWYVEKHVMYAAELDMIVTYGLNDAYGYDAFALDPVDGDVLLTWGDSDPDGDSGYFQAGALGPYDSETETMPLYTGAYPGRILEYTVNSTGINYVGPHLYNDSWGAVGNYLQVFKNTDDDHTIIVTSGAGSPGSPVLMIDLDGDMTKPPEGPLYIDDVKLYTGPDTANLTLVFEDDFESYTLGSVIGQGGWADASEAGAGEGPSLVVDDPTGATNKVVEISPELGAESWEGVKQSLTLTDTNVYRIEYRQYVSNVSQNIYMALTDDPDGDHGMPWSYGWDTTGKMYAIGWENTWDAETPMEQAAWESVVITHDYVAEQSNIVLGGTKTDVVSWLNEGTPKDVYPANKPNGFAIQLTDTTANNNSPTAVIVEHSIGNTVGAYLDQQIAGGPLVGPDGKIYFGISDDSYGDEPRAGYVIALAPVVHDICADANCDGAVNAFDIDPFVLALVDSSTWEATYDCDLLATCDINGDDAVNAFDIDPFVVALVGGGCQ